MFAKLRCGPQVGCSRSCQSNHEPSSKRDRDGVLEVDLRVVERVDHAVQRDDAVAEAGDRREVGGERDVVVGRVVVSVDVDGVVGEDRDAHGGVRFVAVRVSSERARHWVPAFAGMTPVGRHLERRSNMEPRIPLQFRAFPGRIGAMASLNPSDLYDVRSLLTEEERMVQDTVARFTDEKVLPIIGDAFDQGVFPKELIPEIAALGLLGSSLPDEVRLRRPERGQLRADLPGARARRFGHPQLRLGAVARCACTRSTPTAPRSSASAGCRAWRAARSSAASA